MVERGEVITVCRQIGGMMEAGVDILRVTRVLRAQTDNQRLLLVYDRLDHDLTMGRSLVEALAAAPDVWSPFAQSLVQQGEARNDIAGAFMKVADFLQKEEGMVDAAAANGLTVDGGSRAESAPLRPLPGGSPLTVIALDGLVDRLQILGLRLLTVIAGLLLTLGSVWFAVEQSWLEKRWINVTLCSVAALFIGGTGVWVQHRIDAERRREARCSFCGRLSQEGGDLERAPRFAGAAICARCAAIVAKRYHEGEAQRAAESPAPARTDDPATAAAARPEPVVTASEWVTTRQTTEKATTVKPVKARSAMARPRSAAPPEAADEADYD